MQPTKRPNGVWLILIVGLGSVVSTLRWIWRIYIEQQPVSGAAAEGLHNPGALNLSLTVLVLLLTVAFLVALFRMRRVAIATFTTLIVLAAVSNVMFLSKTSHLLKAFSFVDVVASVVVLAATLAIVGLTYFYLRSLVRDGWLT
jgi:hypothetical protein